ncbi:hypothetical protein DIPPA_18528 [Diplonema papillatum]|nr:hypothetical protein DIPPA_18528 [Diplonema papillatum]
MQKSGAAKKAGAAARGKPSKAIGKAPLPLGYKVGARVATPELGPKDRAVRPPRLRPRSPSDTGVHSSTESLRGGGSPAMAGAASPKRAAAYPRPKPAGAAAGAAPAKADLASAVKSAKMRFAERSPQAGGLRAPAHLLGLDASSGSIRDPPVGGLLQARVPPPPPPGGDGDSSSGAFPAAKPNRPAARLNAAAAAAPRDPRSLTVRKTAGARSRSTAAAGKPAAAAGGVARVSTSPALQPAVRPAAAQQRSKSVPAPQPGPQQPYGGCATGEDEAFEELYNDVLCVRVGLKARPPPPSAGATRLSVWERRRVKLLHRLDDLLDSAREQLTRSAARRRVRGESGVGGYLASAAGGGERLLGAQRLDLREIVAEIEENDESPFPAAASRAARSFSPSGSYTAALGDRFSSQTLRKPCPAPASPQASSATFHAPHGGVSPAEAHLSLSREKQLGSPSSHHQTASPRLVHKTGPGSSTAAAIGQDVPHVRPVASYSFPHENGAAGSGLRREALETREARNPSEGVGTDDEGLSVRSVSTGLSFMEPARARLAAAPKREKSHETDSFVSEGTSAASFSFQDPPVSKPSRTSPAVPVQRLAFSSALNNRASSSSLEHSVVSSKPTRNSPRVTPPPSYSVAARGANDPSGHQWTTVRSALPVNPGQRAASPGQSSDASEQTLRSSAAGSSRTRGQELFELLSHRYGNGPSGRSFRATPPPDKSLYPAAAVSGVAARTSSPVSAKASVRSASAPSVLTIAPEPADDEGDHRLLQQRTINNTNEAVLISQSIRRRIDMQYKLNIEADHPETSRGSRKIQFDARTSVVHYEAVEQSEL